MNSISIIFILNNLLIVYMPFEDYLFNVWHFSDSGTTGTTETTRNGTISCLVIGRWEIVKCEPKGFYHLK